MAKNCTRCGKKAQEGDFCNSCFAEVISRRIRKDLKIDLKKGRRLLVFDRLSENIIKDVLKDPKIEILKRSLKEFDIKLLDEAVYDNEKLNDYINKNKISTVILPWTADDEIDGFFIGLFSKNIYKNKDNRFIKLFRSLTNEELARYARIKKIKTEGINKNNEFMEKIAKKYPDIKHSTLRSIEELDEIPSRTEGS